MQYVFGGGVCVGLGAGISSEKSDCSGGVGVGVCVREREGAREGGGVRV